jgi:short-subunit dehydrogenase
MLYALITGASKGIGKAIATELAARKQNLLLVARSEPLLKTIAEDLSKRYMVHTDYLAIDLANPAATTEIAQWIRDKNYAVNILVNNAGYGLGGAFEKYPLPAHLDMMQVNMTVPVALTSQLLPELKKHPNSYILNIASSAAYQAVPGLAVYAASKSFILHFSRGLRYELRKTNISVTAVSPGGTHSDFASRAGVSEKAVKAGEKLNMTAEAVARQSVDAMFSRKKEIITGFVNKLGAFFVWLLPKSLTEKTAASIYMED